MQEMQREDTMHKIDLRNNMLTTQNAKTSKGESLGYLTGILYLAPSDIVDGVNLCPFASKGCKKACLYSAGRGKFSNVQTARIKKTKHFRDDLSSFMRSLVLSVKKVLIEAETKGLTPCIRLNGTSDIRYEDYYNPEGLNIFELFPNVQFYDYTKDFKRHDAFNGKWLNYHLTFSQTESKANKRQAVKLWERYGVSTAIVFDKEVNDSEYINGDMHDLRFLDNISLPIVELKAKGDAKKDKPGFVVEL